MSAVKHFRELDVYQGAMSLVMRLFDLTKRFPVEERYSLIDQIRRSSRSICTNLAEAFGRTCRRVGEGRVGVGKTTIGETQVAAACNLTMIKHN
jgi:four helix bundle protein